MHRECHLERFRRPEVLCDRVLGYEDDAEDSFTIMVAYLLAWHRLGINTDFYNNREQHVTAEMSEYSGAQAPDILSKKLSLQPANTHHTMISQSSFVPYESVPPCQDTQKQNADSPPTPCQQITFEQRLITPKNAKEKQKTTTTGLEPATSDWGS